MSTGLNITSSAEVDTTPEIVAVPTVDTKSTASAVPRPSWLRQALSSETALHQGAFSLADQAVASATNFLTGVIIARASSKEELGLYMLGFSLILLMNDLQTSLITTPYMVYSPRLKGKAHALYTGSTLIHQLTFCLITMLGVACGAFAVSHGVGPRALAPVLWALVLAMSLIMLREHARRVSFARLKLKTAFLFDLFIAAGQIAGLCVLAHFHLLLASRAYWVIGAVCGVGVAGWLWFDRGFYDPRLGQSLADFKNNWNLGKWVFASGLVWAIGLNLCPWLLAAFRDVASAGVWAACLGVVSVVNPVLLGIQNLVGPKISHEYAARGLTALRRLVLKITAVVALPISLVCVVMFIWGGRLLTLLYGRQYAGNSLVVSLLALNLLVGAVGFSFSRALFAIGRARADFMIASTALFIMAAMGLWLIRAFGPLGAAFGMLAANIVAAAARNIAFLTYPALIAEARQAN
jgi:O-antigen/teichoic acid export membrane protein